MFLKSMILFGAGLCAGLGVAAGTFAFFLVIKVLPRMVQKARLEHKVISIENTVILGILFGTIFSLFSWKQRIMLSIIGKVLLSVYGLCAGIFAGSIAVALAEILDTFPIFFRRLKLKENDSEVLLFVMAAGKMIGSLFYFLMGYAILSV